MEVTAAELWTRIKEVARGSVPEHAFHTWIASAKPIASTSDELIIEAQNPFHVEWLEDKFGPLLRSAAERVLGRPLQISVRCASESSPTELPSVQLAPSLPDRRSPNPPSSWAAGAPPRPQLNERYTFDRFVVGANNQLA